MNNREILNRSKKNLTNKILGMNSENVSGAIQNKFQFNIENNTDETQKLAIIAAYLQTLATSVASTTKTVVTGVTQDGDNKVTVATEDIEIATGISLQYNAISALVTAGYPVDVILNDESVSITNDNNETSQFVMSAANPTKKIQDFLHYIKSNPCLLKDMTIVSDTKSAFSTDMEVAKINPFKRNPEELIDLNKFFSKYQQVEDRIDIDFSDNPLELCDDLLWTMNVPAGAKMQITLRF